MDEVAYLGHTCNKHGAKPGKGKTEYLLNLKPPEDRDALARFLGMMNYFRKFIRNYTEIVRPLEELKHAKKTPYVWTQEHQEAFEKVRNKLKDCTAAARPVYDDPERPFHLYTDASNYAIGWCLAQP